MSLIRAITRQIRQPDLNEMFDMMVSMEQAGAPSDEIDRVMAQMENDALNL